MSVLISGGRLVDQSGERPGDVRIEADRIVEVGDSLSPSDGEQVVDATGAVVSPGFVDPCQISLNTHSMT